MIQRVAATLLLISCIACAGTSPFGFRSPSAAPQYPNPGSDLRGAAAALLSQAIRYDTTNPPGGEGPLAAFLVNVARKEGLEARLIETPRGESPRPRGAAWARLRGSGRERPVILLSHLDVVPADPAEWVLDPFAGVVDYDFVFGRGALDAKALSVVHLLAMSELKRRGIRLERDVIFLAVPDEETGGTHGSGVIVREHRELLGNAEFLLAEGGGILPGSGGLPDLWGVGFTEKTPCWIEMRARGRPGHGSMATGVGAVPRLLDALERVRAHEWPLRVVPAAAQMFRSLAPLAPPTDRAAFEDLEGSLTGDPDFRKRFLAEPGRAALVQNSLAITMLRGSPSLNLVPSVASAGLDARLLPGERCPDFVRELSAVAGDPDLEYEVLLQFDSTESPIETDLFRALERVAARGPRPARVLPRVIGGSSDAHYYRREGIVAYGFVPRRMRPIDTRGIHGTDERISLENLELGVETLIQILRELAEGESSG